MNLIAFLCSNVLFLLRLLQDQEITLIAKSPFKNLHNQLQESKQHPDFNLESFIVQHLEHLKTNHSVCIETEQDCYGTLILEQCQMKALRTLDKLICDLEASKSNWTILSEFSQSVFPQQRDAEIRLIETLPPASSLLEAVALMLRELIGNCNVSVPAGDLSQCWKKLDIQTLDFNQRYEIQQPAFTLLLHLFPTLKRKIFIITSHTANSVSTVAKTSGYFDSSFPSPSVFLSFESPNCKVANFRFREAFKCIQKGAARVTCLDIRQFFLTTNYADFVHQHSLDKKTTDFYNSGFWMDFWTKINGQYCSFRRHFRHNMLNVRACTARAFNAHLTEYLEKHNSRFIDQERNSESNVRALLWYVSTPTLRWIPGKVFGLLLFWPAFQSHFYLLLSFYVRAIPEKNLIIPWLLEKRTRDRIRCISFPSLLNNSFAPEAQIKAAMEDSGQMHNELFLYQFVVSVVEFVYPVEEHEAIVLFKEICMLMVQNCKVVPLFLMFHLRKESPNLFFPLLLKCVGSEIARSGDHASTLDFTLQLFGTLIKN